MPNRMLGRRRPVPGVLGIILAGSLLLSACAGQASQTTSSTPDIISAEAAKGGELGMLMSVPTRSFDPADDNTLASVGDATRLSAIYDFLFYLDPVNGEVKPQIGKSLTPNDDGTVWTMTLREGITFSDGSPYDADAVKFTYEHIADKGVSSMTKSIQSWQLEVIDALTLQITIPSPNFHLDRAIADGLPFIISPNAYQADPEGFASNPVGAGPFVLTKYVPDNYETYTANKSYWQPGLPKLDSLRLTLVADAAQRINTIASGDADMQAPSSDMDNILLDNAVSQGLSQYSVTQSGGGWIYFNNTRPPFNDDRARRAVYLALDRTQLSQVATGTSETGSVQTLFVPESSFHESDVTLPNNDREEAQRLFDELAGEGKPVNFTYVGIAGEVNSRTSQFIQAQLSEFENVDVRIDTLDVTAARERVFINRDYDMSPYPGAYKFPDPEPALNNLLATNGTWNTTGYSNQIVDDALAAARATVDTTERRKQYRIVQEQFMEDLPGLFTFQAGLSTVMAPEVTGLEFNSRGIVIWPSLGFTD